MESVDLSVPYLATRVIIVSLSTLGIVEWLKNFVKYEKRKFYAVLALVILSLCVTAQFLLNTNHTMWFNMFTLALSVMQFGHTALVKLPEIFIDKFTKTIGE